MPSKKQTLDGHEKECEHRTVACTTAVCNKTVPLSKLLLHLKDDHKEEHKEIKMSVREVHRTSLSIRKDFQQTTGWISWVTRKFTLNDGKQFLRHCSRSPTGFFFLWVYMIGTPKEAEDFTYTFTLFSANKVIYSGPMIIEYWWLNADHYFFY